MHKQIQWGGVVPSGMQYSYYNYKLGKCKKYQYHLYSSWYNHGRDIHGFGDAHHNAVYGSVYWCPCMYNFGNFYYTVVRNMKSLGLWSAFKRNPSLFDLEKDILSGQTKMFGPSTLWLVPSGLNVTHVNQTTKNHRVLHVNTGVVYNSTRSVERLLGIPCSMVAKSCRLNYTFKKGPYTGWSFKYI